MARSDLIELINLYRFPVGRRRYALRLTRDLVAEDDSFVSLIDSALAHDEHVMALIIRWHAVRDAPTSWPKEVLELDQEHDRLWGAVASVSNALTGLGPDTPKGAAARRIVQTLFASGVLHLIHLPFIEQRERTEAWLDRLQTDFSADIITLDLTALIERLQDINTRFGQLLDKHADRRQDLSYEEVRKADNAGQLHLLQVVADIVGRYNGQKPDDDEERARLLGPILQQQQTMIDARRRRRTLRDVNPDTGEEIGDSSANDTESSTED